MAAGDGGTQGGMELTSYGSGTHGYLPPECYEGDASRICPKVLLLDPCPKESFVASQI